MMQYVHYAGNEPQGIDRKNAVDDLVNKPFTSVEETLVDMAKCVELYIMNECDCDKLNTRAYEDDAKKSNAMKAVDGMCEDNNKLWNFLQDSYKKINESSKELPLELLHVMDNIVNLDAVAQRAVAQKREAVAQRKSSETKTEEYEDENIKKIMSMTLEDVIKKVAESRHDYKPELQHFVNLVENGSSKDLVSYANKIKGQLANAG
jgi:hypothetical protein